MSEEAGDLLMEQAVSAFRERNAWGRIQPSAAWWDLSPQDRETVSQRQLESRVLERALSASNRSSTVRAVLARIQGGQSPVSP